MLTKWTPFANGGIARSASQVPVFDELFREADRLLDGTLMSPAEWVKQTGGPPADIVEERDALVLKMDLPGFDPKALDIQVEGDVLTVKAQQPAPDASKATWLLHERTLHRIARSFVLPNTVDASKCEARCEHGVLTLTLPKREESKPRSITVNVVS